MSVVANIKLDVADLRSLRAKIEAGKKAYAKVGIMANHNARHDGQSNTTIGIIQEKGSMTSNPPIPRRSFLEDPLVEQLPKRIVEITPAVWMQVILERGMIGALEVLGGVGENIVHVGFETGGYGKWAPNSPYTIARKRSSKPLIDSGDLNQQISMEVVSF
jgi:hypothetical protein